MLQMGVAFVFQSDDACVLNRIYFPRNLKGFSYSVRFVSLLHNFMQVTVVYVAYWSSIRNLGPKSVGVKSLSTIGMLITLLSGPLFRKKTSYYWYRDPHCKPDTVSLPFNVYSGDTLTQTGSFWSIDALRTRSKCSTPGYEDWPEYISRRCWFVCDLWYVTQLMLVSHNVVHLRSKKYNKYTPITLLSVVMNCYCVSVMLIFIWSV